MTRWPAIGLLLGLLAGCGDDGTEPLEVEAEMSITVTSSAFAEGDPIPTVYSCDGDETSPPLEWTGVPADAAAVALVVDDPDAPRGTYVHWVVLDIPPGTTGAAEGEVPAGGTQAKGSSGRAAWAGPCPPSGTHHYQFTVYALSEPTGLPEGAALDEAVAAVQRLSTAQGRLVGTYAR